MTEKKPAQTKGPAHRMKIAASMRGNQNGAKSKFSEELAAQYANDPEMLKWVMANQEALNAPSPDGSVAYSDDQIKQLDAKYRYNE